MSHVSKELAGLIRIGLLSLYKFQGCSCNVVVFFKNELKCPRFAVIFEIIFFFKIGIKNYCSNFECYFVALT